MGIFAVGQVIVLPFPFSNLEQTKNRPALLLASVKRGDWIVCQITSKPYSDTTAIEIASEDFDNGGLQRISYVRASKLFTANDSLFLSIAGQLNSTKVINIKAQVIALLQ